MKVVEERSIFLLKWVAIGFASLIDAELVQGPFGLLIQAVGGVPRA